MTHRTAQAPTWGFTIIGAIVLLAVVAVLVASYAPFPAPQVTKECDVQCAAAALDLRAQQHMALAAWSMVVVSLASVALGGVTIWLLRATLLETAKAAKASEDAVREAIRTTTETVRIGEAQARSYLAATNCSASFGTPEIVQLIYANSGQSPARTLSLKGITAIEGRTRDGPWSALSEQEYEVFLADLTAGTSDEMRLPLDATLNGADFHPDRWRQWRLLVRGTFAYRDVFDTWHRETFEFVLELASRPMMGLIGMPRRPQPSA